MKKVSLTTVVLICICFILAACSFVENEPVYTEPQKQFEYIDIMDEELIDLLEYAKLEYDSVNIVEENAISSFRDDKYGQTYYVIGEGVLLGVPCQVTWSIGSLYLFGNFMVEERWQYRSMLEDVLQGSVETGVDNEFFVYLPIPDEAVSKFRLKFSVIYSGNYIPTNKYEVWIYYDADGYTPVDTDISTLSDECCLSHCDWEALDWSPYCSRHGCCKEGCKNEKDPMAHCCKMHNCKKDGCGAHRYDRMNSQYCNMHYR